MRHARLGWLLIACVLAAPIAFAQEGRTAQATRLAAAYWHQPCDGDVAVHYGDLPGDLLGEASWSEEDGHAQECEVELDYRARRMSWGRLCTLVLHEYGHLAGREHTREPHSVMYPRLTGWVAPPCRRRPARAAARRSF